MNFFHKSLLFVLITTFVSADLSAAASKRQKVGNDGKKQDDPRRRGGKAEKQNMGDSLVYDEEAIKEHVSVSVRKAKRALKIVQLLLSNGGDCGQIRSELCTAMMTLLMKHLLPIKSMISDKMQQQAPAGQFGTDLSSIGLESMDELALKRLGYEVYLEHVSNFQDIEREFVFLMTWFNDMLGEPNSLSDESFTDDELTELVPHHTHIDFGGDLSSSSLSGSSSSSSSSSLPSSSSSSSSSSLSSSTSSSSVALSKKE